ncbi:MAG: hypothetical protein A3F11_01820 [Gammaproteobacteria bacterium RIFCSPHIGHO2_12_FULL_37_14]|nr:MAG: hypothetical protein A3F11_01820 [Gammaproteobacteria bacterium RIFCSPHIGHO2_12_FULL_37_14]
MEINLHNINEEVQELYSKAKQEDQALLLLVASRIQFYDQTLQKYLESKHLQLQQSTLKNQELINLMMEINEQYREVATIFKETGEWILEKASIDLQVIGLKLISASKLVPTNYKKLVLNSINEIYDLAEALGGIYLRLGQNSLPTVSGHDDGKQSVADGACGGIVLEWAEQSDQQGTPTYPITSNLSVLGRQHNQKLELSKNYKPIPYSTISVSELDLVNTLGSLKTNVSHYVVIGDTCALTHALGIKKHKRFVEIVDPNYGNFFFRDIETAGIWLAILLQRYKISKFPSENIVFLQRHTDGLSIIENRFISNKMLEDVEIEFNSEAGYQKLLDHLHHHIAHIIQLSQPDKLFYHLIEALKYFHYCLMPEDNNQLNKFINDIVGNQSYDSVACEKFITKDYFHQLQALLTKQPEMEQNNIKASLIKITQQTSSRTLLSPAVYEALKDIKEKNQIITNQVYQFSTELTILRTLVYQNNLSESNEQFDENQKQILLEKINRLTIEIDILNNIKRKLRINNIDGKLIAGFYRKIDYSLDKAKLEMGLILGGKNTQCHLLIGKIKFLRQILSVLDAELVDHDRSGMDLYDKLKNKIAIKKRKILNDIRSVCDETESQIISNEDHQILLENLIKYFPNFLDLPQLGFGYVDHKYIELLNTSLDKEIIRKYSTEEMRVLDNLFQLLNANLLTSIQADLTKKIDYSSDTRIKKVYQDLLKGANELRKELIVSMNLDTDKLPVSHFIELARVIAPANISDDGHFTGNSYDFSSHVNIYRLPELIINTVTTIINDLKMANKNVAMLDELLKNLKTTYLFYQNENIGISDCLSKMYEDLNLDKDCSQNKINEQFIIESVNTKKIDEFKNENLTIQAGAKNSDVANDKSLKIKNLIMIINNEKFWRTKAHFSFSAAPNGVMKMRRVLKHMDANDNDNEPMILTKLEKIARNRTKPSIFQFCFFRGAFRDDTTKTLYKLVKKMQKGKNYDQEYSVLTQEFVKSSKK